MMGLGSLPSFGRLKTGPLLEDPFFQVEFFGPAKNFRLRESILEDGRLTDNLTPWER